MHVLPRLAAALALTAAGLATAQTPPQTTPPPASPSQALPINLIVLMPGDKAQTDAFVARLNQVPYLANAKDSAAGSNITLIVSVAQVPTSGGTAASTTTGLLAASTLGLIPTVENKDISVHYELRANYMTVATFDYSRNFTSVSNIFGEFGKLPEDARKWVNDSVDTLARDIQANPRLSALQTEYVSYFGRRP